jgi:uncharacterized protein YecT (DUF1311 family)
MKVILLVVAILVLQNVIAQEDFYTTDVTKEIHATLMKKVNASADSFRVVYQQRDDIKGEYLEFMIDTFKINTLLQLRLNGYDYSTSSMSTAMYEKTTAYDKLMNRYYKKLLTLLKPEDKKVLLLAQKSWLQFRDNESKLMNTMAKDVYSGGGTIQILMVNSSYSSLIEHRAIQLAEYYLNNNL